LGGGVAHHVEKARVQQRIDRRGELDFARRRELLEQPAVGCEAHQGGRRGADRRAAAAYGLDLDTTRQRRLHGVAMNRKFCSEPDWLERQAG